MPDSGRSSLRALLGTLREDLRLLFRRRRQSPVRQRGPVQRQLLLGLELLWKIEEQVVLPALHTVHAGVPAAAVAQATTELQALRDQAQQAAQGHSRQRERALVQLEQMAMQHFVHMAGLLHAAAVDGVDWSAVEREVRDLLSRWQREVRLHGEIEDEDRDPVGLPPR
jgi:hypothetical protein